jgi:hypothetical protein
MQMHGEPHLQSCEHPVSVIEERLVEEKRSTRIARRQQEPEMDYGSTPLIDV